MLYPDRRETQLHHHHPQHEMILYRKLDETLFLQIFVSFTVVNIPFVVLQFLHSLLLKNLVSAFALQPIRHCR
jgi:hypothetical protein